MRRPLVTVLAATATSVILAAGPASAHDKGTGSAPPSKPAKARIALACRAVADAPPAIRCRWSAGGPERRYTLYRASAAAPTPTLVAATTDRSYEDTAVAAGAWFAYKVRALDANGRTVAASKVVKVRCCNPPPVKPAVDAGSAKPPAPAKAPVPVDAKPVPVTTAPKPAPAPAPTGAKLTLGCTPAVAGAPSITCSWSGGPDGVGKFRLYRKAPGGTVTAIAALTPDVTTFVDVHVQPGAVYSYAVEAVSRDGWALKSAIVTVACC